VVQDFGVFYQRTYPEDSEADYLVTHTDKTFVLGPEGRLRLLYPGNTPAATLADGVRWLLE
jgi:cytochrome oxidase Cu insertion factor (SCO1/SenC/PrrC family)